MIFGLQEKDNSRLVYQTKSAMSKELTQTKIYLEVVSDMMNYFMPGIVDIRKILQARVPIIKYRQKLTDLECDLSMSNM